MRLHEMGRVALLPQIIHQRLGARSGLAKPFIGHLDNQRHVFAGQRVAQALDGAMFEAFGVDLDEHPSRRGLVGQQLVGAADGHAGGVARPRARQKAGHIGVVPLQREHLLAIARAAVVQRNVAKLILPDMRFQDGKRARIGFNGDHTARRSYDLCSAQRVHTVMSTDIHERIPRAKFGADQVRDVIVIISPGKKVQPAKPLAQIDLHLGLQRSVEEGSLPARMIPPGVIFAEEVQHVPRSPRQQAGQGSEGFGDQPSHEPDDTESSRDSRPAAHYDPSTMCGRYTLIRLADFTDLFPWVRSLGGDFPPRYNIAPSQFVPVVRNVGNNQLELLKWGLVPSWAKDAAIGNRMINARAETLPEKPSFRTALKRRRCLVPADGFYEWKLNPDGKSKTPMYIRLQDGRPFAFAGLWEHWHSDDGSELLSFTIITTSPNELMAHIHNRMPVILTAEQAQQWLEHAERSPEALLPLLKPFPPELMDASEVSKTVNNPANDSPDCIIGRENS